MSIRSIIKINEDICNGCGVCVPNCNEGALQIIDGKARLISDLFCDGLGACISTCPLNAITIEEREAEPYDERKVMEENIIPKGENTIKAHLEHLQVHQAGDYLKEALDYLREKGIENPLAKKQKEKSHAKHNSHPNSFMGCPGSRMMNFNNQENDNNIENNDTSNDTNTLKTNNNTSELRQWSVQLPLVSPNAPYFHKKDILLAADCVPFAMPDFHQKYLKGKSLAIACPKLDTNQENYIKKLIVMINESKINTLTVMIMEVPCCRGLLQIAKKAVENANRKIPLKAITIQIQGKVKEEEWI
ncbi:MAG: ATP-binding protein [Candidatus Woesearchaeota archaeon]